MHALSAVSSAVRAAIRPALALQAPRVARRYQAAPRVATHREVREVGVRAGDFTPPGLRRRHLVALQHSRPLP